MIPIALTRSHTNSLNGTSTILLASNNENQIKHKLVSVADINRNDKQFGLSEINNQHFNIIRRFTRGAANNIE